VLLADDHPSLLEVVRSLLKTTDLDVVESVDNGEALFDSAMRLQPEVIVTDISMPRLNGFEAVERLRESGCSSRIVFLTVQSDPDTQATAGASAKTPASSLGKTPIQLIPIATT